MTSRFYVAFVLLAALLGSPAAAYKPLCKDSAGRLVQCAGTLDNTHAPAAPVMSGANITSGTIGAGSITGGSANRIMIDGGTTATWSNTIVGATISCASNTCTNLPASALSGTVGVGNGGTGKNTWTVGAIPVASGVTTIGEIAPGTAGHVLTSNGAGAAPSMAAPVTSNTLSSCLSSAHAVTTTGWEATGSTLSLAAGKWLLIWKVRGSVQASAGAGYLRYKLRDDTAGTDASGSITLGPIAPTPGIAVANTVTITAIVTVSVTSTYQLYVQSPSGPTYTSRSVDSNDGDGDTCGSGVRVS